MTETYAVPAINYSSTQLSDTLSFVVFDTYDNAEAYALRNDAAVIFKLSLVARIERKPTVIKL